MERFLRFTRLVPGQVFLALVLIVGYAVPSFAAAEAPAFAGEILAATGDIRIEWRSMGDFFPREGLGFFVHPDGYVLTSLDLVEDPAVARGQHRSSSRLILLTFTPIGGDGIALTAKIVGRSRSSRLALLKIDTVPNGVLDVAAPPDVERDEAVWVVERGRLVPAVVTDLEVRAGRRSSGFKLDAHEKPRSLGGPILNAEGVVVGVRMKSDDAVTATNRSVSGRGLLDFMNRTAVDVDVNPSVITELRQPVVITLDPRVVVGAISGGQVKVLIGGSERNAEFAEENGKWVAEVILPDLDPGDEEEVNNAMFTLMLTDSEGETVWRRKMRTDVVSFVSEEYDGRRVPDMQQLELDLGKGAQGLDPDKVEHQKEKISNVAGNFELKKNARGSTTVDASMVGSGSVVRPDPSRYENLEGKMLRSLAERFDVAQLEMERSQSKIKRLQNDPHAAAESRDRAAAEFGELTRQRGKLAAEIKAAQICQCANRLWYGCEDAPCGISEFRTRLEPWINQVQEDEVLRALERLLQE